MQHGYSAFDGRAAQLKLELYPRVLRLWERERVKDSILTVASGIFVKLTGMCNGNETLARSVLDDVYKMSHRLELFGAVDHDSPPTIDEDENDPGTRRIRARAHTAWGVFNFVTCVALHPRSSHGADYVAD